MKTYSQKQNAIAAGKKLAAKHQWTIRSLQVIEEDNRFRPILTISEGQHEADIEADHFEVYSAESEDEAPADAAPAAPAARNGKLPKLTSAQQVIMQHLADHKAVALATSAKTVSDDRPYVVPQAVTGLARLNVIRADVCNGVACIKPGPRYQDAAAQ